MKTPWKKFKHLLLFLSSCHLSYKTRGRVYRSCVWMLHASQTWPLTKPDLKRLQCNGRAIIRQNCNVKSDNVATIRSNELLAQLEMDDLDFILREKRLRWFQHVERSSGAIKTAFDIQIDGKCQPGRHRMSCGDSVRSAMHAASQLPGGKPSDVDDAPAPAP